MKGKIAVLLVNLGTPDSPKTIDVGSYLFQFLNDKRVIDIPWLLRKILVNGLIVPFRAPKSAKIYKVDYNYFFLQTFYQIYTIFLFNYPTNFVND